MIEIEYLIDVLKIRRNFLDKAAERTPDALASAHLRGQAEAYSDCLQEIYRASLGSTDRNKQDPSPNVS